jgi:photosystem II stability/assembly factor-like uncharacterized protein
MGRIGEAASCFIIGVSMVGSHISWQIGSCGERPDVHRYLSPGVLAVMPVQPHVRILSVHRQGGVTEIVVSHGGMIYRTVNRGNTWRYDRNATDCQQFPTVSLSAGCVVSNVDPRILYRRGGPHRADLEVSRDGGRSWTVVHVQTQEGLHLGSAWIVGTGTQDRGRLYCEGSAVGQTRAVYVSEDFGKTFRFLNGNGYVVECRANPDILYSPSGWGLEVSIDKGSVWRFMEGSDILISPIFRDRFGHFRSWNEQSDDMPYELASSINQIETDPLNPNLIYVVSFRGLFRSLDAGKTFALLPLAREKFGEIVNIAVDPVEGKYLFAAVGQDAVFVSENYGCDWRKLDVPW